ncbi:hypothetical protein BD779DRAFT_1399766, partial [Infundibulicybe gibba]
SARQDARKADAALRSEIDILKLAFGGSAAFEHHVKQEILALQEAFERAHISTCEVGGMITEVETSVIPDLEEQLREIKNEIER